MIKVSDDVVILKCDFCGKEFPSTSLTEVEGKNVCDECYVNNVIECACCGEDVLLENAEYIDRYTEDGRLLCSEYLCKECFKEEAV